MKNDIYERSLSLHKEKGGAIQIVGTMPLQNEDDLALAYTPGVAAPCLAISQDKEKAYEYTIKGKTIAVITNGTAVLGLGDIGAIAGLPVVEGKALLHKSFGNVDAIPLCIESTDPDEIVNIIKNITSSFGGIHLEDIKAPECFYIERKLMEELDIPVYHDDQHGTAIAVLAGLYNALKLVNKIIQDIKIVINGAGASGIATARLLIAAGAQNIVLCDINGAIVEGDNTLNKEQQKIAKATNRKLETGTLADIIRGADVFIGVSVGNILTKEMVETMNKEGIVFALANPIPEIMPDEAKLGGARIIATGRSDFSNQINNVLVFPGIFKGALTARKKKFNDEMKIAVAKGLANIINESDLKEDYIIPGVFNSSICDTVANAVICSADD